MADEPTTGELYRRQVDHEQRTDRIHGELDDRITEVARESVPLDVYRADQRAREQQDRAMERRVEALEARPQMTRSNQLALWAVIAAFLGVVVAAWAATKGGA